MINKVTLVGYLGSDPEVRHLESGVSVAQFRMATTESYKDKSGEWQNLTEWHNIVCWRGLAESAERNLKKGTLVYVEGKITTRKWQDKEGNDRYNTDIVAHTYRKLERKSEGDYNNSGFPTVEDQPKAKISTGAATEKNAELPTETKTEDDLPF